MVVLVETRISGKKADSVVRRIGFSGATRVEARGFAGGIFVLWKENTVRVSVEAKHDKFIHLKGERVVHGFSQRFMVVRVKQ